MLFLIVNMLRKYGVLQTMGKKIRESRCKDVVNLLIEMANKKCKTQMKLIFILCLVAWHSRNFHILSNKMEGSQISVVRAEAVVNSYKKKLDSLSCNQSGKKKSLKVSSGDHHLQGASMLMWMLQ